MAESPHDRPDARRVAPERRAEPSSDRSVSDSLARSTARSHDAGARRPDLTRRRGEELLIGRLVNHGRATYQYRADQDLSYQVKILTSRGPRTLWGKDLERALRESETQPKNGDLIGVRRSAREVVTVTSRQRDADGHVVSQSERQAHRSHWVVEKVQFFAERAKLARQVRDEQVDVRAAVKAHPELKSAFLSVRAAEEFASQKISDPHDRARFLELIRGAMAGSIQKGEPLPSVRLRQPTRSATQTPAKTPVTRERDEPTR